MTAVGLSHLRKSGNRLAKVELPQMGIEGSFQIELKADPAEGLVDCNGGAGGFGVLRALPDEQPRQQGVSRLNQDLAQQRCSHLPIRARGTEAQVRQPQLQVFDPAARLASSSGRPSLPSARK